MKILIVGHAQHGKDTLADILKKHYKLQHESSSRAALRIFLFDKLKAEVKDYKDIEEAFNDRDNHRTFWRNAITEYNKDDRTKLARQILETNDVYVGMRDYYEVKQSIDEELFDVIIGVYDPRKKLESSESFDSVIMGFTDFILVNDGTKEQFERSVIEFVNNNIRF